VVGAALLTAVGGPRPETVPARTAQAWRAGVRRAGAGLVVQAGTVAAAFGASVYPDNGLPQHADPLTAALDALGRAAGVHPGHARPAE